MNTLYNTGIGVLCGLALPCVARAQDEILQIPDSVLKTIGGLLPERANSSSPALLPSFSPNLEVIAPTEVRLVLAGETAGWKNSVGYFTFVQGANTGIEIIDADLLFPDASIPPMAAGASFWLKDAAGSRRTFQPGEKIGFFLVADGWDKERDVIRNWTWSSPGVPSTDPRENEMFGRGTYTTIAAINPELQNATLDVASHVVMFRMPGVAEFLGGDPFLVMGIEDTDRTKKDKKGDQDFNDNVFIVHASPPDGIRPTALEFRLGDSDGDGVRDMDDAFPDDAERSFVSRVPEAGYLALVFEDLYPLPGDTDFNDAVFALSFLHVTGSDNRLKDLIADVHLVGRGASYDHSFGLHLPDLANGATGTVRLQRWPSGATSPSTIEERSLADVVQVGGRRIDGIFLSTRGELPPVDPNINPFANTWLGMPTVEGASARVVVTFDTPADPRTLGTPPYDPYLIVIATDGTRADVHLPGCESFDDRTPGLPVERGRDAFIDSNGNPWAMMVPMTWQFPLEGVQLVRAYPEYEIWRSSGGKQSKDWYEKVTQEPDKVSVPASEFVPRRVWPLQPPGRNR